MLVSGIYNEIPQDKSYFQDINIKEVSHNSKNRYKGKFERIGNVDVNSLIEQLRGIDVVDLLKESKDEEMMGNKLKESLSPLVEALLPFKELIKREVDFQAIMQGLLINGKTQDGKEIKVYVESNISSLGKMDLALSFTYLQGEIETRIENISNEVKTRDEQLKVSLINEIRKRNMVEPGSLPFLFGVLGRKNNYFGHGTFTTELGKWSSDITKTDYIERFFCR